eukprot:Hpha_TRINITY_DN20305_c0_g1::TRINITY_DN20305_c0_g1_i1::g.138168::m.138168
MKLAELEQKIIRVAARLTNWTIQKTDTPEDISIKRFVVPICYAICFLNATWIMQSILLSDLFFLIGASINFVTAVVFIMVAVMGLKMGLMLDLLLPWFVIGSLFGDFHLARHLEPRQWSLVVCVLDAALVFDRKRVPPLCIGMTLFFLMLERLESGVRLGMYEAAGSDPPEACTCANPPCATGMFSAARNVFGNMAFVLLVDFYFTHGFATGLRTQLRRVNSSVEVAGQITAALVRYDVDGAEKAIEAGTDLPPEMENSFRQLLENLRSYKAYLPHSCLVSPDDAPDPDSHDGTEAALSPEGRAIAAQDRGASRPLVLPTDEDTEGPRSPRAAGSSTGSFSVNSDRAASSSHLSMDSRIMSRRHSRTLPPQLKAAPRHARVSLAVSNVIKYLTLTPRLAGSENVDWAAEDVGKWCG